MTKTAERPTWSDRAALFQALAMGLSYPTDALAQTLAGGAYTRAVRHSAQACGVEDVRLDGLADMVDKTCVGRDAVDVLERLRREYTRLFIGTRSPLVSPYMSHWKALAQGREPVLFLSQETRDVEHVMRAAGVGNKPGVKEPLDHVGSEMEFVAFLCASLAHPDDIDSRAHIDDDVVSSFLDDHVRPYRAAFAEATAAQTKEPLYRLASELLMDVLPFRVLP